MTCRPSEPPRRLSVDPASPHYDAERKRANDVEVYFNGYRQINCVVSYDVDKGELTRYRKTALGVFVRDKLHQLQTETVTGEVRAVWRD